MIVKSKELIVLGAVALVLVGLSVAGLEDKLFPNRVDAPRIKKPYDDVATGGLAVGARLKDKLARPWDQAYVIAKRVRTDMDALVDDKSEDADSAESKEYVTLRILGIMQGSDGVYQTIINRSLVGVNGMVSGCKVVRITSDFVELQVYDRLEKLHLNDECRFRRRAFKELVLKEVALHGQVWKANINGQLYRAGDEVDSETQVRAVTPTEVMVMRGGTRMLLTPTN